MHLSTVGFKTWIISLVICLFMAGCQRTTTKTPVAGFLPPTVVPIPTATTVVVTAQPTPQVNCTDVLSYMEDITIPDGTIVKPGEQLDKRWQVRNNGTCDWTDKFTLHIIAGDSLGSPDSQALYPARAGSAAVIRMMLTAPQDTGSYRTAWQAYNPDGKPFGDPIYIEVVVK
jgi:hypothetical protein